MDLISPIDDGRPGSVDMAGVDMTGVDVTPEIRTPCRTRHDDTTESTF